ncbi:hypothetical protein GCM10027064_11110 [Microbacterium petrolearium]
MSVDELADARGASGDDADRAGTGAAPLRRRRTSSDTALLPDLTLEEPDATPTTALGKAGAKPTAKAPKSKPKAPKSKAKAKPARTTPATKPRRGQLVIGAVPRADLLPPELRRQREGRRARDGALVVVLGAALLLALGVGGATAWAGIQTTARDRSQALTTDLTEQQLQFGDANTLLADIHKTEDALEEAAATDVLWAQLLTDLQAALPSDAGISSLTIDAPTPGEDLPEPTGVLQAGARAATVQVVAHTSSAPDIAEWLRRIAQIEGVVYTAPRTSEPLDGGGYRVELTFDLGPERLRAAGDDVVGADDPAETAEPAGSTEGGDTDSGADTTEEDTE